MKWKRKYSNPKRWAINHLVNAQGAKCAICGNAFNSKKQITIDHVMPLCKGGEDTIANYQLAHYGCNLLKDDLTPEEFDEFQAL